MALTRRQLALEACLHEAAQAFLAAYPAFAHGHKELQDALRELDLASLCMRLITKHLVRQRLLPAPHVLWQLPGPWPPEWISAYPLLRLPMLEPGGRWAAAHIHLYGRLCPSPPTEGSCVRDDFAVAFLRSGIDLAPGVGKIYALLRRGSVAPDSAQVFQA